MQNLDASNLGVLEINSVTLGYRALDALTKGGKIKILEAAVHAADLFLILIQGPDLDIRQAASHLVAATTLRDREVIIGANEKLLATFYSLHTARVAESLVILETETLSGLFSLSQRLLEVHTLEPIEIRLLKGGGTPRGLAYFTGSQSQCRYAAEDAATVLRDSARKGSIEVIEKPSSQFCEFFNLQGA